MGADNSGMITGYRRKLNPRNRRRTTAAPPQSQFNALVTGRMFRSGSRPGFCICIGWGHLEENDMPNRGELARATRRPSTAAAAPADAWPIVGFCALGFLMSIFAASSGAIELIHRIF
jgi:hypothetical protein